MARHRVNVSAELARARAGEPEGLGKALDASHGYLLAIARQIVDGDLRAKADAEDLVQETFLEASRDLAKFHGTSECEWLAWMRQLLLNNAANFRRHFRTAKRQVQCEQPLGKRLMLLVAPDCPRRHAVAREQATQLEEALARLPVTHRQVLQARFWEQRSFEDICRQLGRSVNAVRKLFARALTRLEAELQHVDHVD
jgi:RNA polymerase sigma-70 factor, ECF subfamily